MGGKEQRKCKHSISRQISKRKPRCPDLFLLYVWLWIVRFSERTSRLLVKGRRPHMLAVQNLSQKQYQWVKETKPNAWEYRTMIDVSWLIGRVAAIGGRTQFKRSHDIARSRRITMDFRRWVPTVGVRVDPRSWITSAASADQSFATSQRVSHR